jgi:hypothetical protein
MEGSYTQAELKGLLLCTNWLEDFQYDEAHGHLNESDQAAEDEAEEAAAGAIFDVAAEEALIGLGAPELHQRLFGVRDRGGMGVLVMTIEESTVFYSTFFCF